MNNPQFENTFEGWRDVARSYLINGVPPSDINWSDSNTPSFDFSVTETAPARSLTTQPSVPKDFLNIAKSVAYARDEDRWQLLYRILYRLHSENPNLMKISVDPDIMRAARLAESVRRDIHKLHAFVRFKKVLVENEDVYMAWHRTEHFSIRPGTPFFARRFGDRRWSIFTPDESAHWDLENLTFGKGLEQHKFHAQDSWDEVWKTYYKAIFNPARIKVKMMKSEMSPKYWESMPETALIPELLRDAPQRLQAMALNHRQSAQPNAEHTLNELKVAASSCTACPLSASASQTVFGEGAENARIMIVGEQPGDQEDLSGRPFVGPSGEILDQALKAAGIERAEIYITNAVKHFKFERNEKMRIHKKASGQEMHACKPWLEAEIARIKPEVIIALGVTAATAVIGRLPKIKEERGQVITDLRIAPKVILSWHPSAILRASSEDDAKLKLQNLFEDVRLGVDSQRLPHKTP